MGGGIMKRSGNVCGAVSLVVVFGVLCMAVFTALTYVTSDRERRLSELDAQRAEEFYRADLAAVEISAALKAGDRVLADRLLENAEFLLTETADGTLAEFSLPAGGEQRLDVRLLLRDGDMEVLRWKKAYGGTWEANDTIVLADIGEWEW